MLTTFRTVSVPRPAWILIILAIVLALASAALYAGSHARPAPFGLARTGLIAFDAGGHIYVANGDGSGRRTLTSGSSIDTSPQFSPDGTEVAYFSRPSSGAPARLTVVQLTDVVQPVAWAPDSRHMVYMTDVVTVQGFGAAGRLEIADLDKHTTTNVPGLTTRASDPAWSPDGRTILLREVTPDSSGQSLYLLDVATMHLQQILPATGDGAAFGNSQWSPDGRWILTYGGVWPHHIEVIPADGSSVRRLTTTVASDEFFPTWSSSGQQIAWEVGHANGPTVDVWVASGDGSGARQLNVANVTGGALYWSPDDKLLFGYGADLNSIVVFSADGSTPTLVIPATGGLGTGNWQRLGPCPVPFLC
jgi:Tol biopolymer transport system component